MGELLTYPKDSKDRLIFKYIRSKKKYGKKEALNMLSLTELKQLKEIVNERMGDESRWSTHGFKLYP